MLSFSFACDQLGQATTAVFDFTPEISSRGLIDSQVVLYFYPSDGSPGCTKQAAAFTQSYDAFKKAGAVGVQLLNALPVTSC